MSSSLQPGEEIAGRYVIEGAVGRGGMGAVYRVVDKVLGEPVALKLMDGAAMDATSVERFRREVRVARKITHKNVARTFDIGEHQGTPFLTMELVPGTSLASLLRERGRFATGEAIALVLELCEGLAAAHDAGVVHRDLKPANVLVDTTGRVTILDFGIARSIVEPTLSTGSACGTPAYMAPEQLTGDTLDAVTDLFALGVIFHQLLAGRLPRWGDPGDVLARLDREGPELFLGDDQPAPVCELIRSLLRRDPGQRPTSAREVAARLRGGFDAPTAAMSLANLAEPAKVVAPVPDEERSLAVLPFRDRGAEGLGEELAEGLVDALSRARGLRVLSMGATARFGSSADPQRLGRELGVDLMVEGSAKRVGNSIQVTARCIATQSGVLLWSERFEGSSEGLLALEDALGQRVAEALRFELTLSTDRSKPGDEALQLFLTGRRELRASSFSAVETLERAVRAAPDFKPALAALALARVRAAFATVSDDPAARKALEELVARALEAAPALPDSHLAAGMLAAMIADYGASARHLRQAVSIAPTFALAQEYLGRLQCECGRSDEGVRRLELALTLDPALVPGTLDLARHYLFHEKQADHERLMAEVVRRTGGSGVMYWQLQARKAVWTRNREVLAWVADQTRDESGNGFEMLKTYAAVVLADSVSDALTERFSGFTRLFKNPRFVGYCEQLAAEAWAVRGETERSLAAVQRAARSSLADLEWLERCPVLVEVRKAPCFPAILREVRERTRQIWID